MSTKRIHHKMQKLFPQFLLRFSSNSSTIPPNTLQLYIFYLQAGAKALIPLGDLLHPGILTNIAESKVVQILCHGRWTFNGHGFYAHVRDMNE